MEISFAIATHIERSLRTHHIAFDVGRLFAFHLRTEFVGRKTILVDKHSGKELILESHPRQTAADIFVRIFGFAQFFHIVAFVFVLQHSVTIGKLTASFLSAHFHVPIDIDAVGTHRKHIFQTLTSHIEVHHVVVGLQGVHEIQIVVVGHVQTEDKFHRISTFHFFEKQIGGSYHTAFVGDQRHGKFRSFFVEKNQRKRIAGNIIFQTNRSNTTTFGSHRQLHQVVFESVMLVFALHQGSVSTKLLVELNVQIFLLLCIELMQALLFHGFAHQCFLTRQFCLNHGDGILSASFFQLGRRRLVEEIRSHQNKENENKSYDCLSIHIYVIFVKIF